MGVTLGETVGVFEHVGASTTLPAGHAEGQPQVVHTTLEVAPSTGLKVPAPHSVGVAELSGQ